MIMGSNMAENHPVGFQWVMEARERGAEVIHVDPRFTRTSAMATTWVAIRAGTDIAFLGGVVNYIFEHERWFDEYVKHYTNAPVIVDEGFRDTEDVDGLFSGWDPEKREYDARRGSTRAWRCTARAAARAGLDKGEQSGHGGARRGLKHGEPPVEDATLQHPRCIFQILKRHYAATRPRSSRRRAAARSSSSSTSPRRSPQLGSRADGRVRLRGRLDAAHRRRPVHPHRAIVQQLLGNIGRPGGGIIALRGHASIQGSTDIPRSTTSSPATCRCLTRRATAASATRRA